MNAQRWMSIQFFSFYMTWGIFLPFWTGWMIYAKGISVTETSLIMSFGLIARGLSTLFAFPYLSGKLSSRMLLNISGIGTLAAILLYIPANTITSVLIVTVLFHLFYPILMPALDSAASVLVQNKQLNHYGPSRQWGSIGFVSVGMIITIFTGKFGDGIIYWAFLISIVAFMFFGLMRTPTILSKKPKIDPQQKAGLLSLFRTKNFSLVMIIVILLQAAHATYYNYGYIYLQDIQAPIYLTGLIINIAVIAEIIFFSIADKVFHHFSVGSLLALAAVGSTIRWILVFAFPSVMIFSVAQIFHAFSFAMAHYAFMRYLIKNIPHAQIANAQGMYSALAMSWSTAIFTVFGGYLYEIEPRLAFIGMIVCTIPAMLLALVYRSAEMKRNVVVPN